MKGKCNGRGNGELQRQRGLKTEGSGTRQTIAQKRRSLSNDNEKKEKVEAEAKPQSAAGAQQEGFFAALRMTA